MGRIRRDDTPDAWHHVMNRGIARRPLHENDVDVRAFLARVASCARSGWIEVHAYTVLTNHFHMLVRSPRGELARAMQFALNGYARWFNRVRDRDGPLYRGRYRAKRVTTLAYRRYLVRYIDFNAVEAGLVSTPAEYPFGSARAYASRRGPPWLTRDWVEQAVRDHVGAREYQPRDYARCFGRPLEPGLARAVEARIAGRGPGLEPLDRLLEVAGPRVVAEMQDRARLADGGLVGLPVCDPDEVLARVRTATRHGATWRRVDRGTRLNRGQVLAVLLLRSTCGSSWGEIAERLEASPGACWRAYQGHWDLVQRDPAHAEVVARVLTGVLAGARGLVPARGVEGKALAPPQGRR